MSTQMLLKRPESLSKLAEDRIRLGIIRGEFKLGESLKEAKLSAEFGISKTPVREALAALNLQGLIEIVPQKGAFVFRLSRSEVVQLCRYRLMLECSALEQSMAAQSGKFVSDLEYVIKQMSRALEAGEISNYLELDARFHDTFFDNCGNDFLRDGYRKVSDLVATMRTHLSNTPERTGKSFQEHQEIVASLKSDNREHAKAVLEKQVTRGERSYTDLIAK